MAQITYSVSFWTQFLVSRDLFTDLTKGKPRFFPTAVTYSNRSNSKLYVQKNNYVSKPPVDLPIEK